VVRTVPTGVTAPAELAQTQGPETRVLIVGRTQVADGDVRDLRRSEVFGADGLAAEC
jgi:hypothetical protein